MKNSLSIFFISLFLICSIQISAEKLKQHPKLIKGKLSNGLTYYIYPNAYPKGEAVYRLFIKSGSVYEKDTQRGLAHFLEHMAFNGTTHFPNNTLVHFLESKGAKFGKDLNAHTSFNETVYKLQLPSSSTTMVDTTLTILSDWACGFLLDSTEINDERGVIMSEWLSRKDPESDVNNTMLLDLLNESRFSKRLVIGDTAVIKHFKYNEIRDYYKTWYQPQLMAVAIVGDVDPAKVEKMIVDKFGSIRVNSSFKAPAYDISDYSGQKARIITNPALPKVELNMMQLLPKSKPVSSEKDYPDYLFRLLLNRLMTSRMNTLALKNPTYVKGSVSISDLLNTKTILMSTVELNPSRISEGICEFTLQTEQMFRYGFLRHEIEKVKKVYLNQMKRKVSSKSPEPSENLMNEVYADFYKGNTLVSLDEEYRLLQKYIDRIDSVSIVKMLQKSVHSNHTNYLLSTFENNTKSISTNHSLLALVNKVQKSPIARYEKKLETIPDNLLAKEPLSGKITKQKIVPEIDAQEYELSNGVKVIFKHAVTEKNKISISAFRKGGSYALDSVDYVTSLTTDNIVSLSGAGKFSRESLSNFLAGNTSSVRFLIEKTRSGVVGGANLQDVETLFQLLYLKWCEPKVDSLIFKQLKEKSIQTYLTANKTDETKFYEDFSNLLKSKDYTTRELTDSVLVKEMIMDRVLPIFNQCFGNASGYTFVIMADCPFDEIKSYVMKYIGGLPEGSSKTSFAYNGGNIRITPAILERKVGDSPKATVSLVFQQKEIPISLSTYNLQNKMLCDVVKMKLLNELREKMGMVYSVGVTSGATLHPSPLSRNTISFRCLPQNVEKLIVKTVEIVQELERDPQGFELELNDVKTNLIKAMKIEKQKDSFWSSSIRNKLFNNENNWDDIVNYEKNVQSITASQIARLIPEDLNVKGMIRSILLPK